MRSIVVASCVLLAIPCLADRELVVGVDSFPPCVEVSKDGRCTGFDIDVLEEVAKSVGFRYRVVPVEEFTEVFDGLRSGRFDLAMSGITINEEREASYDFSHPYLDSGLRILVRSDSAANTNRMLWGVAVKVFQKLRWLLLLTLIVAHVVWFMERGDDCFDVRYFHGILQAIYWAVVTMSTVGYGDYAPKHPIGRICTVLIIIVGVATFGFVVAQVTADVTTQSIVGIVTAPEDLKGHLVGVPKDTTSVQATTALGAKVKLFEDFDAACEGLKKRQVEAVVFDSPAVLHRAVQDSDVKVAGELFDPQKYGIVMREGCPMRERINRAVLGLVESDRYRYIETKWFGSPDGG